MKDKLKVIGEGFVLGSILYIIAFSLAFFMGGFINGNWYFTKWSTDLRVLTIILSMFFSIGLVVVFNIITENKSTNCQK